MSLFSDNPYYHQTTKKLISSFGELFSDIRVIRRNTDGTENQVLEVPIEYSPRNKWMTLLQEDPEKQKNVEITLPRIGFEIVDYSYDATRKIGAPGNFLIGNTGNERAKLFNPVPYNVSINLYSLCKTQGDSLQILEQILPYFTPSLSINIEILPEFSMMKEIPITLRNIQVSDTYEGLSTDYRLVEQTFSFVAQMVYFGPINSSGAVIKHTKVSLTTGGTSGEMNTQDVNPESANKDGIYTIDEAWVGFE